MKKKGLLILPAALGAVGVMAWLLLVAAGADQNIMNAPAAPIRRADLSASPDSPPARPIHLLFVHHSCGGQLLATPGPEVGTNCIMATSTNGGGLRESLRQNSYVVHEASYGSRLGEKTDIFDWPPKFRNHMEELLSCSRQDEQLPGGERNQIIVFKSCFPNNLFVGAGEPPGRAEGPELTLWNARAAYAALLPEFQKQPSVLFVCVTAPPMVYSPAPAWKRGIKRLLGRRDNAVAASRLAREFNGWLAGADGWLKDYPLANVVVFDYYDILTGFGKSNFTCYPAAAGDSHPSREGNGQAARAFVPFLNRAAHRAGLAQASLNSK